MHNIWFASLGPTSAMFDVSDQRTWWFSTWRLQHAERVCPFMYVWWTLPLLQPVSRCYHRGHTLLDMILSALRECCMLMAILIYMAMPLPTVLGHSNRKDRCSWTLAAIFPALLAMLVFPVVRHDAICAGNLHCYLFGLCKVAMILSYQCLGRIWRSPVWISCWPAVNQPCKLCKSPPFICLKGSVFF